MMTGYWLYSATVIGFGVNRTVVTEKEETKGETSEEYLQQTSRPDWFYTASIPDALPVWFNKCIYLFF